MKIIEILVGKNFLRLIDDGNKVRESIKEGGDSLLQQSSPELERYFSQSTFLQGLPNPISPALLSVLFLILYVCGTGGILNFFQLSPPISALFALSPVPVIAVCIALMSWTIRRGSVWGVRIIFYFYLLDLFLTLISFLLPFSKLVEYSEWTKQLQLIPAQLVILYITRDIMNGDPLSKLVSYFRLKRVAQEACKIKNNHINKRKNK